MICASDATFAEAVSNGRITQKLGPGTLTFGGTTNMNGALETRKGAAVFNANTVTLSDAVREMANLPAGTVLLGSDSALARVNLLAGGSFTPRSVVLGPNVPVGGVTEFNFDGGTLRAFVSNAAFFDNVLTNAFVKAGGGTIDTNGFDITIAQPLRHDPALGATPDGGTTSLRAALGAGASVLNVDAIANTNVSQTLAALSIGPGGVFTIDSTLTAPAPAFAFAGADSGATAVPEPTGFALLLGGLGTLASLRRRRSQAFSDSAKIETQRRIVRLLAAE